MSTLAPTPRSLAPVGFALAFTLVPASYAANITWANSAGNTTWTTNSTNGGTATSNSWAGGNAPVNSVTTDNAIFASVSNAQPALTVQTRIAGIDFQMAAGGLAMSGGGGSGQLLQVGAGGIDSSSQTSGTNTITNARISVSGSAGTWNLFSSTDTVSTSTFTFNSTVDLANNLTVIGQRNGAAGNVGNINFTRAITGSGTLTINSASANNNVTLSGTNTYTGITTVNTGNVTVQNDQSAATGGWNIQTPNTAGMLATVNFVSGSTIAVASANKIQIGSTSNSGAHPASTLNVAGTVTNNGTLQMERASVLNLNSGAAWSQNGNLTLTARGGASATLNVNAGSEMTYTGSNTVKIFPAPTSGGSGSLNIDGSGRFTTGAGFENTVSNTGSGNARASLTNGGTLRLSAAVANLTTQVNLNLGTGGGVIDNGGFTATLNGAVTSGFGSAATGVTGTGGLTSTGNGTLTLTGTNTYSGATLVSAGTLAIGSTGSINSTSGLTVASGATFRYNSSTAYSGGAINNNGTISGTGTLNVAVTLDSLTDTLAPGNSPGVQNFGGGQTWNSFTYEWEINNFTGTDAGIDFDKITIGGTLNLTGGPGAYVLDIHSLDEITNLTGDAANFSETSVSWTILTASGGITGFDGANWSLIKTNFTNAELGTFALAQSGNDLILTYTPVPEPSAYAAIAGFGMMGFALCRRRRRQQKSAAA